MLLDLGSLVEVFIMVFLKHEVIRSDRFFWDGALYFRGLFLIFCGNTGFHGRFGCISFGLGHGGGDREWVDTGGGS